MAKHLGLTAPDVLIADPPWQFRDALPGAGRGAVKHYNCLGVADLCAFTLPSLARNAVMFFWRVSSMQPEALQVIAAWGFKVKSELVWLKTSSSGKLAFGMGHYVRASHETCLICVRGSALPAVRNVRSVFEAPRGVHSAKPDAFYRIVSEMYPQSRKVEMFARTVRSGFEQYGDQLGLLGSAEEAV